MRISSTYLDVGLGHPSSSGVARECQGHPPPSRVSQLKPERSALKLLQPFSNPFKLFRLSPNPLKTVLTVSKRFNPLDKCSKPLQTLSNPLQSFSNLLGPCQLVKTLRTRSNLDEPSSMFSNVFRPLEHFSAHSKPFQTFSQRFNRGKLLQTSSILTPLQAFQTFSIISYSSRLASTLQACTNPLGALESLLKQSQTFPSFF